MPAFALRKDPGGTGQGHNTDTVRSHPRPGSNSNGNIVTSFDAEFSNQGQPSGDAILTRKLRRAVQYGAAVRRLTPVECERLQGFPDNWTRLDDTTPDSRRYAALGDAVTVNVAEWIGRRLMQHAEKATA